MLILAAAWGSATSAAGRVEIPDPGTFVIDRAGILDSATRAQLEALLRELEQKTSVQLKVLTVSGTDGEDFFAFVQRHAERWKLGAAGRDNGVLVAVVPKSAGQRGQVRVHPGYGLESVLPDSWCGSLSREVVERFFKAGHYSQGVQALVATVANTVADSANVKLSGGGGARLRARPRARHVPVEGWLCGSLLPLLIVLLLLAAVRRRRHRGVWGGVWEAWMWAQVLQGLMGGGRSRWRGGFGSGFGRSLGGGFGGSFGGGGRFGGGGGGASW